MVANVFSVSALLVFSLGCAASPARHPRLYFTASDLPRLREMKGSGIHARIWRNLADSADPYLNRTPRQEWIAPISPDPIYENLYDRFYAIMADMSIVEHMAFADALSGNDKYGEAARQWTLSFCRVWAREADGAPDDGKAYAVSRWMKGVAVGYDLTWDRLTTGEREEVRNKLAAVCRLYYKDYFSQPPQNGPEFSSHHAIVEYASFGVAALVLLGEVPDAQTWLDAVTKKFEEHLLPMGLAQDGACADGATFWASTMQSRLFFMDALRRVTGRDLFGEYSKYMNADVALASIAAEQQPGWDWPDQTVVLAASYGQLDYYSPVLLYLAREYRRPIYQYLALWDRSLGSLRETHYVTPTRREQLLFSFGGYAYVWCDETVEAKPDEQRLSYFFPSMGGAFARASWRANDLLVGMNRNGIVIHAGGSPVLIASHGAGLGALEDDGKVAVIRSAGGKREDVTLTLRRPDRVELRMRAFPREVGLTERDGRYYGWLEVEDLFSTTRPHVSGFKAIPWQQGVNKPSRELVAWGPAGSFEAPIEIPANGEWRLWLRGWTDGPRGGAISISWDGKPFYSSQGKHEFTGDAQLRFDWLDLGSAPLIKGRHVLGVEATGDCGHMLDVLVLTTDPGYRPDETKPLPLFWPASLAPDMSSLADSGRWEFWCLDIPVREQNELRWKSGVSLRVMEGAIMDFAPEGFEPPNAVGYDKLALFDPAPRRFPKVVLAPSDRGEIVIEVHCRPTQGL